MATRYEQLLDATMQHLQELKARGARFVAVQPDTLASLARAPRGPAATPSAPAPAPRRAATLLATMTGPAAAVSTELKPASASGRPESASLAPDAKADAKADAMAELRQRALACVQCPNLAATRQNVVFGVGDIHSPLMFVGEAPGADEDEQGEPFVGKAGQLLTRIIQTMGLSRDTVYIANILKCRPDTPGQSAGNRKPTPEEMARCFPYLHAQIDLIQPKVIVALGATAVEGLLGKGTVGITRLRGQWREYRGTPLMPTFHPSYLQYNQALSEKRKVWEDMLAVMERLGLEVSEKQRGYFLSAAG